MLKGPSKSARIGIYAALLGVLISGITASVSAPMTAYAAEAESRQDALNRLGEVYGALQNHHVSAVTDEQLTDAAIQGMIASLNDPYTVYFTKTQWEQYQNELGMRYVGIGTRLSQDAKGTLIVEVFQGSPAFEAGLLAGDYIVEVNGESTETKLLDQVADAVRGLENSEVSLTVKRIDNSLLTIKVNRRAVTVPSVISRVLSDRTGYIQVTGFTDLTDEDFAAQLEQLKKQDIARLIVDLRNNPGGVLESAQHMAEQFIPKGTLIHTKDRNGKDNPVLLTNGQSVNVPVVVLVNEGSASASEVFAGAVQDYGKAAIVGSLTYGKGSVQSIFKLSSGAAVKVTIEQYFTPLGKPVNKVGITPDVSVEGNIPQFISALRAAGSPTINVTLDKNSTLINGLSLAEKGSSFMESGIHYAPARLLASLVGGQVTWNEQAQAVVISSSSSAGAAQREVAYKASNGFVNRDGVGYLDVDLFRKQFPELHYEIVDTQIVLKVGTGKENR